MVVQTEYMGEIKYEESDVIEFYEGLYGFEEMKRFLFVSNPQEELPFHWLQSVDDARLTFIVTTPFLFVENYEFEIPKNVLKTIEIDSIEDVSIYSFTVIPENIAETTINLKAPLLINFKTRKAKQLIVDEKYPYKKKIFSK